MLGWPNLGCLFEKDKFQEMSMGCRQGGVKLATAVTNGSSDVAQSIKVEYEQDFTGFPKKENPSLAFASSSDLRLTFSSLLVQIRQIGMFCLLSQFPSLC